MAVPIPCPRTAVSSQENESTRLDSSVGLHEEPPTVRLEIQAFEHYGGRVVLRIVGEEPYKARQVALANRPERHAAVAQTNTTERPVVAKLVHAARLPETSCGHSPDGVIRIRRDPHTA